MCCLEQRYFMDISYLGKDYPGWQRQKNVTAIQNILEEKMSIFFQKKIRIVGSSRTDAGVHALQQFAHVDLPPLQNLSQAVYHLNQLLPIHVAINQIYSVKNDAHARFDAIQRTYVYKIIRKKNPFTSTTHHYLRKKLCRRAINQGIKYLSKTTNFSSFSKKNPSEKHFLCQIFAMTWHEIEDEITFSITANRFLRGMVRAIVGTLLCVGQKQLSIVDLKKIIHNKDRCQSQIKMAPAQGLYLKSVIYPDHIFFPSHENTIAFRHSRLS